MRQYKLGQKQFYSNASEITLPASLTGVIAGVGNLNSLRPTPQHKVQKLITYSPSLTTTSGSHYLVPADIQTIYNVNALYSAGYTGAGQTLVVVGQSAIDTTDLDAFHTTFGGSTNLVLTLVPFSGDSAVNSADDEGESDLDIEYSGSIAKDATVNFVYTGNDPNYGVFDAVQYAIDNNLAPIISISYGACEANLSSSQVDIFSSMFDQANAQGQSLVAASGDSGATACDRDDFVPIASSGLTVQFPSDSPDVTGIGGTEFDDASGTFWSPTNGTGEGSALGYIPEVVWNDTDANGFAASGGGVSMLFTKPTWQTGVGVPDDGARDIPDISFDASNGHDPYFFCGAPDSNGHNCSDGYVYLSGGTSFGAPIFAGVLTLINQSTGAVNLGNINPVLYPMAASAPSVFHDITKGNNDSPCYAGSTDCPDGTTEIGYSAGTGYDLATGLGSADAFLLAKAFPNYGTGTSLAATKTALSYAPALPNAGANITFTATVTSTAAGTPSGTVVFSVDGNTSDPVTLAGGLATYSISPLQAGNHLVTALYSGDSTYAQSAGSVTLPVAPLPPTSLILSLSPATPTSSSPITIVAKTASAITGTITGTIDFTVDGTDTNNPITIANGSATLILPALPAGTHTISGQYSGDSNFAPTSGLIAFTVLSVASDSVTIGISPAAPSIFDTVSATATVTAGASGNVQFLLDGKSAGDPASIAGASAIASLGKLAAGSHTITANYLGDTSFAPSTSSLSFIVSSPTKGFTLKATDVTVASNQSADSTVTVTSTTDYAGTVQLSVSGTGPANSCFLVNNNPTVAAHASASAVIAIYTGTSCTTTTSAQRNASVKQPASSPALPIAPIAVTSLAGAFLFGIRRRLKAWKSMMGVLLLATLGMTLGCGGGSKKTTTPVSVAGTYTLTVTGTDSATPSNTTSTTFTLTVQ